MAGEGEKRQEAVLSVGPLGLEKGRSLRTDWTEGSLSLYKTEAGERGAGGDPSPKHGLSSSCLPHVGSSLPRSLGCLNTDANVQQGALHPT